MSPGHRGRVCGKKLFVVEFLRAETHSNVLESLKWCEKEDRLSLRRFEEHRRLSLRAVIIDYTTCSGAHWDGLGSVAAETYQSTGVSSGTKLNLH